MIHMCTSDGDDDDMYTDTAGPALSFRKGLRDGLPICLGYLSVSFAYGMMAVEGGLPVWAAVLISMTNLYLLGSGRRDFVDFCWWLTAGNRNYNICDQYSIYADVAVTFAKN